MTSTSETIRKDSAERILGDKAYFGDQEVVGLFRITNHNNINIFKFDPDTGILSAYNTSGAIVWQIDTATGIMTLGATGVIKLADGSNDRLLIGYSLNRFGAGKSLGIALSREGYDVDTCTAAQMIFSSQFTLPKESNVSFGNWSYTNNTVYEILYNNACKIDFDDWPDSSCYLEVTGKTGGGTAYFALRNITDGSDVAGSECTTTSTTPTVFRSGAFTKPSGSKQLALQYKVSSAAYYCDVYSCRVVMRYT